MREHYSQRTRAQVDEQSPRPRAVRDRCEARLWIAVLGVIALLGCPAGNSAADLSLDLNGGVSDGSGGGTDQAGGEDLAGTGDMGGAGDLGGPPDLGQPPTMVVSNPPLCTASGWCWENPLPQGNPLGAVWAFASDDVWAAGGKATLLHFDGQTWKWVNSGTDAGISYFWGSTANNLWAVGDAGTILHWDGVRWISVPSGTNVGLRTIWGSGPNDIWAGGEIGTLLRWQGASWQRIASNAGGSTIYGLWGSGPSDVWATRSGLNGAPVLHWDGAQWSVQSNWPKSYTWARALWGDTANSVWFYSDDPVRWDGQRFSPLRMMSVIPARQVWGSGPNDFWALGAQVIKRGNGIQWGGNIAPTLNTSADEELYTLRGSSGNDVWASSYRLHRWNGARWTTTGQGGPRPLLADGWGSPAGDAWAVGAAKNALGQNTGPLLRRINGAWQQTYTADQTLTSIWGSSTNSIWAVGDGGMILRWDGSQWNRVSSNTSANLSKVRGIVGGNTLVVGEAGFVAEWTGATWLARSSGTVNALFGVYWSSTTEAWAVGEGGTIIRWNGSTWNNIASGTIKNLTGIWGTDRTHIWAVGVDGIVLFWDGNRWAVQDSKISTTLLTIHGMDSSNIWAAGEEFVRWDGVSWTPVSTPIDLCNSIFGASRELWAVGLGGRILHYTP